MRTLEKNLTSENKLQYDYTKLVGLVLVHIKQPSLTCILYTLHQLLHNQEVG